MTNAWIVGAAQTDFGAVGSSPRQISHEVVRDTLADAGLQPRDVEQVFFGNAAAGLMHGQEMIRGEVFLQGTGLLGAAIVNVENACASSSTAFHLAAVAVQSGQVDVALAMGVEVMSVPDKARIFGALASAVDTYERADMKSLVETYALGVGDRPQEVPKSSPLMIHYAEKSKRYMARTDAKAEDFAEVVVKSRAGGQHNAKARFRYPTSVSEVLQSRTICEPLTLPMCSPVGDGGAGVLVVSDRVARERGLNSLRVRASSLTSRAPEQEMSTARRAARIAYERADIQASDLNVVELHDAAASAELQLMEELELCGEGEAAGLLRAGRTQVDGDIPVNPSGGLLSRGHPIGATGCAQLVELIDQIRERCGSRQVTSPRLALAQNSGGILDGDEAVVAITILERTK